MLNRIAIKAAKIAQQGGLCAMPGCANKATELHEIVSRGRTMKNEAARNLSFQPELTAVLCRQCHDKAMRRDVQQALLAANIERYGREAVEEAMDALQAVMRSFVGVDLPDAEATEDASGDRSGDQGTAGKGRDLEGRAAGDGDGGHAPSLPDRAE